MKPGTLLLTSLLLSGLAAAQTTTDAPEPRPGDHQASGDQRLTVTLPGRVQQAQFTVPASTGVTAVQIGAATYTPAADGDLLRWTVPNPGTTLTLTFNAPVPADQLGVAVQYDTGLTDTLAGTSAFQTPAAAATEADVAPRDGIIQFPSTGPAPLGRSSTNVTTVSELNGPFTLLVNGQAVPDTQIGRRVDNSGTGLTTREYIALPLQPGENTITAVTPAGQDSVTVTVAGVAASARLLRSALLADGFTPLTVTLDVTDAQGRPTVVPTLTVTDTGPLTLITPDGDPAQAGHQLRLDGGRATLTFAPTSTPGPARLTLDVNNHPVTLDLTVTARERRTVVALVSGTISGLGQTNDANGEGRATIEAPILGGQLTAVVDSSGAHTDTPAEVRFPSLGDASRNTRPLQADGPVAARFDHPDVTAVYARNAATDPVFGAPVLGDALNVVTKGATQVHLTAAPYAGSILDVTVPINGTRLAQLPAELDPARAQLTLRVTRGGVPRDTRLVSGRDYVIDAEGLITFTRPLFPAPDTDTTQQLIARGPTAARQVTPHAQLAVTHTTTRGELTTTSAAGVHLNATASGAERLTYGVHYVATDSQGPRTLHVDARAAFNTSGTRAEVTADAASPRGSVSVAATHETPGFTGYTATGTPGSTVNVTARAPLSDTFSVQAGLRAQTSDASFGVRGSVGAVYTPTRTSEYTAGLFTGTGDLSGTGVTAGARWTAGPWTTTLSAQQQLTSANGQYSAQVTRKVPLPERMPPGTELAVGTKVSGTLTGGTFTVRARAVLEGRAGPYTAALEYGLPTVNDRDGEVRGSVSATFPVTPRLNVGGTLTVVPGTQTLTGDLRYTDPNTVATAGVDLSRDDRSGPSTSVRFSVSRAGERLRTPWGVTADGLSTFTTTGAGHRYALGATYRGEQWNAAAYLRVRAGQYAQDKRGSDVTAEANVTVNPGRGDVRLGLAALIKSTDPGNATAQGVLAGRYWFTQDLALGAAYRGLYTQSGLSAHAYALEGSWRFATPAMLTLGYNVGGFTPITAEPTRPGAYLRLDFLLDDTDHTEGK
ncbi:hypothetical protein [Deinococcus sedimenti]|uniref:Uncharacterized protein n=1 Tax=Deinococcus sedimenti TaxID=1867090 RepID=A0ABQ2SB53_9DEIO|nr:hypothetical protein [Deinococcus sedimenti]GGS09986.1 hypothetical protein GCM10008960_40220 [Deinococcus sedimenti]